MTDLIPVPRDLLNRIVWRLSGLPIKHPQQSDDRKKLEEILQRELSGAKDD